MLRLTFIFGCCIFVLQHPVSYMKAVFIILISCFAVLADAQNTDLPSPDANLQTLANGSYVIAMDNSLQLNTAGDFNLKAYGLVVYLLNNNIRVKWSIKAGKLKDAIDFTASAEQLKPTLIAGGTNRDFKAGPFVIEAADTTGVGALIDAFYSSGALTGNNRPKVYRLTAAASNVDIRYDLGGFHPKAAILTDGGNENIHIAFMVAASVPTTNYTASAGAGLITNCFTFASEPHNTNTGTIVNNTISTIKYFVQKGGNFLAQCAAVENYENNSLGRFQTTTGITVTNTNIASVNYANADLGYSQFEGAFNASLTGSVKNWQVVAATINNEHDHATGIGTNASIIGASVSKLVFGKGGLVFYLGNHNFSTGSAVGINGIRMYLNAFLTPSNTDCPVLFGYGFLPLKLTGFSGKTENRINQLNWMVEENESAKIFEVEKSSDGKYFSGCGIVAGTGKTGKETYYFSEEQVLAKIFYRLKITGVEGSVKFSDVIVIQSDRQNNQPSLSVINSEVIYQASSGTSILVTVYDTNGKIVYRRRMYCVAGSNRLLLPQQILTTKGFYAIESIDLNSGRRLTARMVRS